MIVDVCSRRTGLARIISQLILRYTPGLLHFPVHWSPSDEEQVQLDDDGNNSCDDGGNANSCAESEACTDNSMSPPPLLLAIRNHLTGSHGRRFGLPLDPRERLVQAKGIGNLLRQILTPVDVVAPHCRMHIVVTAADMTSVLLHCVLPILHRDHPSLLAGLVTLRAMGTAHLSCCAGPVMHMLQESIREVSSFDASEEEKVVLSEIACALDIIIPDISALK